MIIEKNILTKEGQRELKDELKFLIDIERPKVIEAIKDARALGDLSENAEFDAARQKQGEIESRIKNIDAIIQNSEIVKKNALSAYKVSVGSSVTIEIVSTKVKEAYIIVGTLETNPFEGKISNKSPLAKAILGMEKGDVATVLSSKKYKVKILSIKNS
ncbi:transcription elongation factor GreA [Candidatus Mycoplasma mahonii]|uniref:transcription elongation factor GreA n=1 Tax=Candidatus Mycoplasma mahonii TaxID=3004105 RepID=UPI0026F182F8|nr:transcription elongation factor GreA [Candidatus Mycoplasma mahonii]WKX02311.1 transcription elongation factor GreA [Candidatus Mycoplasma mahonii]